MADFILLEDGQRLELEAGDYLLLEESLANHNEVFTFDVSEIFPLTLTVTAEYPITLEIT